MTWYFRERYKWTPDDYLVKRCWWEYNFSDSWGDADSMSTYNWELFHEGTEDEDFISKEDLPIQPSSREVERAVKAMYEDVKSDEDDRIDVIAYPALTYEVITIQEFVDKKFGEKAPKYKNFKKSSIANKELHTLKIENESHGMILTDSSKKMTHVSSQRK